MASRPGTEAGQGLKLELSGCAGALGRLNHAMLRACSADPQASCRWRGKLSLMGSRHAGAAH